MMAAPGGFSSRTSVRARKLRVYFFFFFRFYLYSFSLLAIGGSKVGNTAVRELREISPWSSFLVAT